MVDHLISSVWQAKKLKGKAKAMVVTRNIECAIRYPFAIRTALQEAHPHLQRNIFKQLLRVGSEETDRSLFVTTHSPNIASVSPLKSMVVLRNSTSGTIGHSLAKLELSVGDMRTYNAT